MPFLEYDDCRWMHFLREIISKPTYDDPVENNHDYINSHIYSMSTYDDFVKMLSQLRFQYYNGDREECKQHIDSIKDHEWMDAFCQEMETMGSWDEFMYVVYTANLEYNLEHSGHINQACVIRQIITSMRLKETALAGMDLYGAAVPIVEGKVELMSKVFEILLCSPNYIDGQSTLFYNMFTYFIPKTKTYFDHAEEVEAGFNCEKNKYKEAIYMLVHKEERYSKILNLTDLYESKNVHTQDILYAMVCTIFRKNYYVTKPEFDFVLNYIEFQRLTRYMFDNFQIFCSHMIVRANEMKHSRVFALIFTKMHEFCMRLIRSKDIVLIKKGLYVYKQVYRGLYLGELKLNYTGCKRYDLGKSPFYMYLVEQRQWAFGQPDDLREFFRILHPKSMQPFLELFQYIHGLEGVIPQDTVFNICFNDLFDNYREIADGIPVIVTILMRMYLETDDERNEFLLHLDRMINVRSDDLTNITPPIVHLYPSFKILTSCVVVLKEIQSFSDVKLDLCYLRAIRIVRKIILLYEMYVLINPSILVDKVIEAGIEFYFAVAIRSSISLEGMRHILQSTDEFLFCNIRKATVVIEQALGGFVKKCATTSIELIEEVLRAKLQSIKTCTMLRTRLRHATEYRVFIHGLCAHVPKEYKGAFIDIVYEELINLEDVGAVSCGIRMQCFARLVSDPALRQYTRKYWVPLMAYCLLHITKPDFALHNAASTLFEAILARLMPSKNKLRNMSLFDVSILMPDLYKMHALLPEDHTDPSLVSSKILFMQLIQRTNNNMPMPFNVCVGPVFRNITRIVMTTQSVESLQALDILINLMPEWQIPLQFIETFTPILALPRRLEYSVRCSLLYVLSGMFLRYKKYLKSQMYKLDTVNFLWEMEGHLMGYYEKCGINPDHYPGPLILKDHTIQASNIDANLHLLMTYADPHWSLYILQKYCDEDVAANLKIAAIEALITHFKEDRCSASFLKFMETAVTVLVNMKVTTNCSDLLKSLGYILFETEFNFTDESVLHIPIRQLTGMFYTSHYFLMFYTQVIARIPNVKELISKELDELITTNFYSPDNSDAMFFYRFLLKISNNRPAVLSIGVAFLTFTADDAVYVRQAILKDINVTYMRCTFEQMITAIFSHTFLNCFFKSCNCDILQFISHVEACLKSVQAPRSRSAHHLQELLQSRYEFLLDAFEEFRGRLAILD